MVIMVFAMVVCTGAMIRTTIVDKDVRYAKPAPLSRMYLLASMLIAILLPRPFAIRCKVSQNRRGVLCYETSKLRMIHLKCLFDISGNAET